MEDFKQVIELLNDSKFFYVAATGTDGIYRYVNDNYARVFGLNKAQMIGRRYDFNMDEHDRIACKETSEKCFKFPDRSFPVTIHKYNGKGGNVFTQWEFRAMMDKQRKAEGIFCVGYDITEHVEVNQQLKAAKSEIKHKKTELDRIYWEQSHVIRRPVANIIGLVNILNRLDPDHSLGNIYLMLDECANELDMAIKNIVMRNERSI